MFNISGQYARQRQPVPDARLHQRMIEALAKL
jgi:hypothetical protein